MFPGAQSTTSGIPGLCTKPGEDSYGSRFWPLFITRGENRLRKRRGCGPGSSFGGSTCVTCRKYLQCQRKSLKTLRRVSYLLPDPRIASPQIVAGELLLLWAVACCWQLANAGSSAPIRDIPEQYPNMVMSCGSDVIMLGTLCGGCCFLDKTLWFHGNFTMIFCPKPTASRCNNSNVMMLS